MSSATYRRCTQLIQKFVNREIIMIVHTCIILAHLIKLSHDFNATFKIAPFRQHFLIHIISDRYFQANLWRQTYSHFL